jgi:hypothetical protein
MSAVVYDPSSPDSVVALAIWRKAHTGAIFTIGKTGRIGGKPGVTKTVTYLLSWRAPDGLISPWFLESTRDAEHLWPFVGNMGTWGLPSESVATAAWGLYCEGPVPSLVLIVSAWWMAKRVSEVSVAITSRMIYAFGGPSRYDRAVELLEASQIQVGTDEIGTYMRVIETWPVIQMGRVCGVQCLNVGWCDPLEIQPIRLLEAFAKKADGDDDADRPLAEIVVFAEHVKDRVYVRCWGATELLDSRWYRRSNNCIARVFTVADWVAAWIPLSDRGRVTA